MASFSREGGGAAKTAARRPTRASAPGRALVSAAQARRMSPTCLPRSPISSLRAVELTADDVPLLQRFFEANPEYFLAVQGEPAGPNEAHDEIHDELPEGWRYTKKWLIGFVDAGGALVAMANLVSDIFAPGVWNISLFMLATSRHGSGDAQALYRGLEA